MNGNRLIVVGFVLVVIGVVLTVVKIGFDVSSIGNANDPFPLVGLVLVGIGARRRRHTPPWVPPRQADRFTR